MICVSASSFHTKEKISSVGNIIFTEVQVISHVNRTAALRVKQFQTPQGIEG